MSFSNRAAFPPRIATCSSVVRLIVGALLIGINLWIARGAFEPIARDGKPIGYFLVARSFDDLAAIVAVVAAAMLLLQVIIWRRLGTPRGPLLSAANTVHWNALGWLAFSLLPCANLVAPLAGRLGALSYVFFDLRWFWWPFVLVEVVRRVEPALVDRASLQRAVSRPWLIVGSLIAIPIASAIVFSPIVRFSGVLHGDEPKYLRFCENFYQGLGFDVSKQQAVGDRPDQASHVLDNLGHMWRAVPEEAALLVGDARRVVGLTAPPPVLSGEPSPDMFFAGKHPGTVYQLHNPGLSFLLFPAYYLDRRLTGGGLTYRKQFPSEFPAVHVTLLALYAGYALALYGLLSSYSGVRAHAWILALMGALTLPSGAFAFQIYPEVAAGLIVFVVLRTLIRREPSGAAASLTYGLLAGFLPWLHVRFSLGTAVLAAWMLTDAVRSRRARVAFAFGVIFGLLTLSLYTYRLTGSLLPSATYGADAPMSFARVAKGLPAFALDRVWGLFPHSPIYLLSLAGLGLAWRRRAGVGWILALIAAMAVPAAGHGFWAGGSTPGRYLVAIAPVLLLFVADTMAAWCNRRIFVAAIIVLSLASLETGIRYNLNLAKGVGPLVAKEFSGWRFNLLFPSLGAGSWTASSTDLVLLAAWIIIGVVLMWASHASTGQGPEIDRRDAAPARIELRPLVAGLTVMALLGAVVGAATGEPMSRRYLVPLRDAREHLLRAFAGLPRCGPCYASTTGTTGTTGVADPTAALGNEVAFVDLRAEPTAPRAGQPVRIRVRPRSRDGEYVIGLTRLDRGDGSGAAYRRAFGDVDDVHVFTQPGDYEIRAWVNAASDAPVEARLTLRVGMP